MRNCQPPCKIWQASHMMTIFISLLCVPSFLGATLAHLYTVWKVKPSSTCGPYRTLNTIYKSTDIWLQLLKNEKSNFVWFPRMHKFLVENPFLVIVASGILLIVIYFHWQVLDGQRKIIKLLNAQIMNEGDDKKFLIGKLKDFNKKKYKPLKRQMHEETEDWSSIKNKLSLRKAIHKMGLRSKLLSGMTQEEQILAEDFENWFYKRFYILQKCFFFRTRVYIQVSERKVKCSSDILHLIIQQTFIFKSHLLCIFQVK